METLTTADGRVTVEYDAYVPPASPAPTMFGNTPDGAESLAALAATDAKYGVVGKVVRWYFPGSFTWGAVPSDRAVVMSFKGSAVPMGTPWPVARRTFWFHEIDHQVISGAITLAAWSAGMKSMRLAAMCLTADAFVNSTKDPAAYLAAGGPQVTHLGVDFDGISPTKPGQAYHDYGPALAAVQAFLTANPQITSWGVPEFGADQAPDDTDGSRRAAWLLKTAAMLKAAPIPPEYVCVWEDPNKQPGSVFRTPVEITAVRALLTVA